MTVQTTTNLSNAIRTKYHSDYIDAMEMVIFYDQLSTAIAKLFGAEPNAFLGSTETFNFLSDMAPATTAVSQTADITPQVLVDATNTITPTSRADGIQWAESVDIQAYTNWGAAAHARVGKAAMESAELLAQAAALQGTMAIQTAVRASLDAGTSTHLFTDAALWKAASTIPSLKCPPFYGNGRAQWLALLHTDLMYDLIEQNNILAVAQYQDKEILFRGEIGQLANFKLLASPWAKVFGGAGADNASNVATTLSADAARLAVSATIAASTNVAANMWLTIGTEETANTHQPTNERVRVKSDYTASTTLTFVGEGANGGFRFAHLSGAAVRNADHAYPVAFGTPMSLAKVYAADIGPFPVLVGPKVGGLADQFKSLAFKWYGNYGRITEATILRGEYACSLQA